MRRCLRTIPGPSASRPISGAGRSRRGSQECSAAAPGLMAGCWDFWAKGVAMDAGTKLLVEDSELVVATAVSLGRSDKSGALATTVAEIKAFPDQQNIPPEKVAQLQIALGEALAEIAPITLGDLRNGWRPYTSSFWKTARLSIFGVLCFFILASTAYITLIYDRVGTFFNTTKELQTSQGGEMAAKLYFFLKKYDTEKIYAGGNDQIYEQALKQIMELHQFNKKLQSYSNIKRDIDGGFNLSGILNLSNMFNIVKNFQDLKSTELIVGYADRSEYDNAVRKNESVREAKNAAFNASSEMGINPLSEDELTKRCSEDGQSKLPHCMLNGYFHEIRNLMQVLRVGVDPLAQGNFTVDMYRQQAIIDIFGRWILPALYGMIGSILFFARRYVDAAVPDPSFMKFLYRMALGAFAGVIAVGLWTPAASSLNSPSFTSTSAFGLAFVVGFSTDVFFGLVDRLAKVMSDAVGK